jgi:N-acetylglucosaminyldiphosphoundecaprenol N-acetyl-beta-D-mannosaminyltransferase
VHGASVDRGHTVLHFGKRNILGVQVSAIDYEAAVARIVAAAAKRERLTVSALAVHGVMTGVLDSAHQFRLNHLDLVVPDGQPVRWALKLLHGVGLPDRVYGPTLMKEVCEAAAARGLSVFLYGSRPPVLAALAHNLQAQIPRLRVAGIEPSRFRCLSDREQVELADRIQHSAASMVFVALGCPRQEVWVYEMGHLLNVPLIAVGAAFDFHAGTLPQAPPRWQRLGLEWLFRLGCEPRRLWRRYVYLNPAYVGLVAMQALRLGTFHWGREGPPPEFVRFG